jgi:RNA-directed DNA polymerase
MHENREPAGVPRSGWDRGRSEKAQSRTSDMHAPEDSDRTIVPMNQSTKENIVQSNTSPTQSGERVSQGLRGVREVAKVKKRERFTALLGLRF